MIICKNENANLIAMENQDPEGLKPYQRKSLAWWEWVLEEWRTMRRNTKTQQSISPDKLAEFALPITEETDNESESDEIQ